MAEPGMSQSLIILSIVAFYNIIPHLNGYVFDRNPRNTKYKPSKNQFRPWPYPAFIKNYSDNELLTIYPSKLEILTNIKCDIMENAIERYANLMFSNEYAIINKFVSIMDKLLIIVDSKKCEKYPELNSDESYRITFFKDDEKIPIDSNYLYSAKTTKFYCGKIVAKSIWGALRGLETFSQLINYTDSKTYVVLKQYIKDKPLYRHRGLLIDTARHYIPVHILKNIIEAMSYNKLNVFHWHIVDDQSFPYQSEIFPELSKKGAYTPHMIYTKDDIKDLIEFARLRGIRIIPELDTPAHTYSWGKSHPEILTPCYGDGHTPETANYPFHASRENLNPLNPATFNLTRRLLKEISQLFPDKFFHAGMDEVFPDCWDSNLIMKNVSGKSQPAKWAFRQYTKKILPFIQNTLKRHVVVWQDMLEMEIQNISKDLTYEIWKNFGSFMENGTQECAKKNYKMIISGYWYLDTPQNGEEWKKMYDINIDDYLDNDMYRHKIPNLLLGGEACMWTEYVDVNAIMDILWPRTSAIAEKLWSPKNLNQAIDLVEDRLEEHRCLMIRRGIVVKPIKPGFCGDYEDLTSNKVDEVPQWIIKRVG
ncbi:unnamed protein product [Gordionus sp. m RMFG-2023]|uniref:beta-hexosaminidase subunit beta-like isoform X2 n=1 Tax=Gordionus sp. m RMFG-2023 TaxID=3053472 RepID=UPI0030DE4AEF